MNTFDGFKETRDAADIKKDSKLEISQAAQDIFDRLMGDENLPEAKHIDEKHMSDAPRTFFVDEFKHPYEAENEAAAENEINQPHEPNSEYKIGEDTYETDDMGNTYKKNSVLFPNSEYIVNGNTYRTDENGNKVSCDAEPEISEEGKRNIAEQREVGGEDRREGDQGGHIIARVLGGAEGEENLIPMRGTINQGDYKKMELEIIRALEEGKQVGIHIDIDYDGESSRPTKITAEYTIDGKKTEVVFDNEENSTVLIDTLDGKIADDALARVKGEIEDMKKDGCPASITSVKTELDESGNAARVIVGLLDESTRAKSYKVFYAH